MHMTPARDPKLVNVLRLEAKRSCQDLVAKIGQPALGSQDLVARSWKPQCGSTVFLDWGNKAYLYVLRCSRAYPSTTSSDRFWNVRVAQPPYFYLSERRGHGVRCSDVLFRDRFVFLRKHMFFVRVRWVLFRQRWCSNGVCVCVTNVSCLFEQCFVRFVCLFPPCCDAWYSMSCMHSSALVDWFLQCACFVFEYFLEAEKYNYILENSDYIYRKSDHGFG